MLTLIILFAYNTIQEMIRAPLNNRFRRLVALLLCVYICANGPTPTSSLQTFDCQSEKATFQVIDLTEPAACPDPIRDFEPPVPLRVQILQTDTAVPVKAHQCRITMSKTVTRCGFTSISYGIRRAMWEKNYELTPRECENAVKYGELRVEGRNYEVPAGTKKTFVFYSHGSVDRKGNCKTSSFVTDGQLYTKSYEETILVIHLSELHGSYDLSSGTVSFRNGLTISYKHGVLRDAYAGTIVWNSSEPACQNTVSQVYEGNATLHRMKGDTFAGSIVMVNNEATGQHAGLLLQTPRSTCRAACYSTQVKGIVACMLREMEDPIPKHAFKPSFQTEGANLRTEFSGLYLRYGMFTGEKFEEMSTDICDVQREVIFGRFHALAGSSNP